MNVKEIEKLISDFSNSNKTLVLKLKENSEKLREICHKINTSWSGSSLGHHAYYYYDDFSAPPEDSLWNIEWGTINGVPDGWKYYQGDEVKNKIETFIDKDFKISNYTKDSLNFLNSAKTLQQNISMEISDFNFTDKTLKENELYVLIEKFDFGNVDQLRADSINGTRAMGSYMTRDTKALSGGKVIPSQITTMAGVYVTDTILEKVDEFILLVERFIKQVTKKLETSKEEAIPKDNFKQNDFSHIHPTIKAKCFSLYQSEEYAEAVEKSFKVVRDKLRELTGHETGSEAFGKGKLHIKGASAPNVDKDFNEAVKFLTMAIDMFRNEKSHTSDSKIGDPIRAYQYLAMSSLALSLLENSEIKV